MAEPNYELVGIRRLILTEFRNHQRLDLSLNAPAIVLYGANGAGKTNILEAITVLGPGRNMRSTEFADMIRKGGPNNGFAISASLGSGEHERRIGVGLDTSGENIRKITRLDGRDVSAKDLLETLRIIWATPTMDRIFAGAQGERRKFLDRIVTSFMPEISAIASNYEKAIKERQKILESDLWDPIWLNALEEQAALAGVALASARLEAIDSLQSEIEARPDGPFPKSQLVLDGILENSLRENKSISDIEIGFARELRNSRDYDKAAGRATKGPHRTNLSAIHLGNGMPAETCSTGEQKALLFGLILAQARCVSAGIQNQQTHGFERPMPIILLDEANAHFDAARREGLAQELLSIRAQSWLSGTDKSLFENLGESAEYYAINAGEAIKS